MQATQGTQAMLTVGQVAELLNCSQRHVYRLVEAEKMPRPLKVGQLNRWALAIVQQWIADGCQAGGAV